MMVEINHQMNDNKKQRYKAHLPYLIPMLQASEKQMETDTKSHPDSYQETEDIYYQYNCIFKGFSFLVHNKIPQIFSVYECMAIVPK